MISTPQKIFLGSAAVIAFLFYKSKSASASPSASPNTGNVPSSGGLSAPPAGNGLLVTTQSTDAAGRLNIRTNPGTNYPEVALANHGDTLVSLGNAQTASDGSVWWNVKTSGGTSGWAESNYLQDLGPMTSITSPIGQSAGNANSGVTPLPAGTNI